MLPENIQLLENYHVNVVLLFCYYCTYFWTVLFNFCVIFSDITESVIICFKVNICATFSYFVIPNWIMQTTKLQKAKIG
jgi:hypothetical protein